MSTETRSREFIILISHTDLDGASPYVVLKNAYPNARIYYAFFDYNKIDQGILDLVSAVKGEYYESSSLLKKFPVEELNGLTHIFITDISPSAETAAFLDKELNNDLLPFDLIHLDHHETAASYMKPFSWSTVLSEKEGQLTCGTSLLFDYLLNRDLITFSTELNQFVECVRLYDTWDWKNKPNPLSDKAKLLNDYFYLIGRKAFLNRFAYSLTGFPDASEGLLLSVEQKKIDAYLRNKERNILLYSIKKKTVGVVFAEQYTSELGNYLVDQHPDFDYVILINPSRSLSFRSSESGEDVSQVALIFGGGGHQHASGAPISQKLYKKLVSLILKRSLSPFKSYWIKFLK